METAKWFTFPVIVALVAGLIIGFAAGAYRSGSNSGTATSTEQVLNSDASTTDVVAPVVSDDVAVSAVNQAAGMVVNVSDVKLDKVTWLAIKKYDDNKLGNVIGAHRLPAGTYATDQIELVVPTVASSTYAVVMFYDNGDLSFSSKSDIPVERNGSPVFATFTAQ